MIAISFLVLVWASASIALADASSDAETDIGVAKAYAVVELIQDPVASYKGGLAGYAATKPASGEKLDLSSQAVQKYQAYLLSKHAEFKAWLEDNAPRARVLREYTVVINGLAIELKGTSLSLLKKGPHVAAVTYSWLYRPSMNLSLGLIQAQPVWDELQISPTNLQALAGIRVGVVDTGIDEDHPFIGPCRPEPITHQVFFSGAGTLNPDRTIFFDHGTHVAGTIGGCPTSGNQLPIQGLGPVDVAGTLSGVAPGVALHDYNVFPGYGAGFIAFGGSAFSHDIIAALEQAVIDGMDVLNLSLGGGVAGPHDTLSEAINGVVSAGLVAAVAAGNSGPGDRTVESPGNAEGALTAGASTNPHFVGITVMVGMSVFGAALGDFVNFELVTAMYTATEPADGCTAIATDLTGKIALIDRGVCTFTTKIRNAQDAGAIGVLIVNNVAGDPIAMGHDGTDPFPTIPAAMLSKADGDAMKPSGMATVDGTMPKEFLTTNADIIAGFSSRGPTPFDFRIKPDVTAPGVNVLSSVFGGEYAFFQGTSMATPHVAGSAALLLALHDGWSPQDVKSALVNTADRPVTDHVTGLEDAGVLARGGGRVNVAKAATIPVTIGPASVSFGLWSGNVRVEATKQILFRNQRTTQLTCSLSAVGGWPLALSTSSLVLPPGGSATVFVTLSGGRMIGTGDFDGDIVANCDGTDLRAPWWTRVDRTGGFSQGSPFTITGAPGIAFALDPTPVAIVLVSGTVVATGLRTYVRTRRD